MDKIDPGPGYRLLEEGELVQKGDEFLSIGDRWIKSRNWCDGSDGSQSPSYAYRRKLPTEAPKPTVAPAPGSPEDKASLAELDALIPPPAPGSFVASNEALRRLSESMAFMGPPKDSCTIQEVRESQEVRIKAPWPSADECRRSLEAAGIKPEDFAKSPGATILQQDFQAVEEKIYGTLASLGLLHLLPKPFTPNKYTRELLTLDGRRVPVDVYSVLAAFPVGNSAVDHALKKLLAPGQRGQKDRLQDLKEARASLDRAIQMEGG